MRAFVTGQIGVDKGPYLNAVQALAQRNGIDLAVCVWSDDGSVGMLVWYYSSASKVKAEFPKLRGQMEQVG